MAEGRRRQVPAEQRRAELARAALAVMVRDGAWTLTTRAVAQEAGVPHGAVHYAFASKAELLRAVMRLDLGHLSALAAAERDRPVHGTEDVAAALRRLVDAYADTVIADPGTEAVYFELALMGARDPDLGEAHRAADVEYRHVVTGLLADLAARAGASWDADLALLAEHLLAVLYGASANWLTHRDDALLRAVLDDAARALARRLTPAPHPPHPPGGLP